MKQFITITILFLVGCTAPVINYVDPEYNFFAETPVPSPDLTGYWVGMSSNTQENFLINADGTGLYCADYGVNSSGAAIKVIKKKGKTLLITASWYYSASDGNNAKEKKLSSSLPLMTKDFFIYSAKASDISVNCRKLLNNS